MQRAVASLLMVFFVIASVVVAPSVSAQLPDNATRDGASANQLMAEYWEATQDCSSPSLECLVYHTVNFVGIELVVSAIFGGVEGNPFPAQIQGIPGSDAGGYLLPENNQVPPVASSTVGRRSGGAVPGIIGLITQMYDNPPAQTSVFIADVMNNAGIATPAYAQGLGFSALSPILSLWKIFRNLAYTFFVIIFMVVGFMIMFRTKLGGNAAVTVQQAIPSILLSLVFVTFSYAIGGFMIDLMYLMMALIIGLFQGPLAVAGGGTVGDFLSYDTFSLLRALLSGGYGFDSGVVINDMLSSLTGGGLVTGFVAGLGGVLVSVVIAIAIVIGWFKLFFELLRSYATVILSIVTAPIQLMAGAIPGRDAFRPWLKDLIGNLLPFPTVIMVLVMYYVFTQGALDLESGGFMPPFLVGTGQGATLVNILGLAIILSLPEIVKKVKEPLVKKGGFGELLMTQGLNAMREGWQGRGPGPLKMLSGRNFANQAAWIPGRIAGAGAARWGARKVAKDMGLSESQITNAGRAATAAGFLTTPTIARNIAPLGGIFTKQAAQALAQVGIDRFKHKRAEKNDENKAAILSGVVSEVKDAYNTPGAPQGPDPSQVNLDKLKRPVPKN